MANTLALVPTIKGWSFMHRRLVISLATMMGAFALLVVPIAPAAPAHAAVVAAEQTFLQPDDVVPISLAAHQGDFWEQYLADEGYPSAMCTKDSSPDDSPYQVPDLRLLAVVIANDGLDWENTYEVYLSPPPGSLIEHEGLLHVFICQPEQGGGPLPSSTPPVVETDRVGDTGGTDVALVLAAGAITAGAAALFLARRRQGSSADAPPPTASGGTEH